MDAIPIHRHDASYTNGPPVLVFGSSAAALAIAQRTIEASGVRLGARASIEDAGARIDRQIAPAALWIELDRHSGDPTDQLLLKVGRDVSDGQYSAVVSTRRALRDRIAARLGRSPVELIVDADEAERAAALATARSKRDQPLRVCDVAGENNTERLRQLSDEVNRIASTLARLSNERRIAAAEPEAAGGAVPQVSVQTVRAVIRARRLRSSYFPADLFADPAWDMMLDLLQAEIAQLRVPVSSVCLAADVPATTALRWLKMMVAKGLFIRHSDPHDGRRVFVELAPRTSEALRRYFGEIERIAGI